MKSKKRQNINRASPLWTQLHVYTAPDWDDPNATLLSLLEFLVYIKVLHTPVSRQTREEIFASVTKTFIKNIAVGRPDRVVGVEPTVFPISPIVEVTIGPHIPITKKLRDELIAKFLEALQPVIRLEVERIGLADEFAE